MGKRSRQLVFRALVLEGVLLAIAIIWIVWQKIPLGAALTLTLTDGIAGISAGLILLGINYVLLEYGSRYIEFFQSIKQLIEHERAEMALRESEKKYRTLVETSRAGDISIRMISSIFGIC